MSAKDYKVTFGYKAQDGYYYGPNGTVGLYHRGNDRPTPSGTLIVIAGKTIGKTGNSGVTGGPHLHTQAGTDKACQKDINPTPYEFKPGKVVAVGTGSQWGKYITMQVGTKFITYAHLSSVSVKVGDIIKEEEMYKGKSAKYWYEQFVKAKASQKKATGIANIRGNMIRKIKDALGIK